MTHVPPTTVGALVCMSSIIEARCFFYRRRFISMLHFAPAGAIAYPKKTEDKSERIHNELSIRLRKEYS